MNNEKQNRNKSEIETLEVAGFASGHSIHLHEHEHVERAKKIK